MNTTINKQTNNPLVQAVKNIVLRLTQSPDVYPIKFYMKRNRFRRSFNNYAVK